MDEILYSLKNHSLGMNAGRWDYIFSAIKRHREVEGVIFPDRSQITMTVPFMKSYTELLVQSLHKRGAHAIGGMSAFIPDRKSPDITEEAFTKVKNDKIREAEMGFDGSWVAHPDLVKICKDVFSDHLGEADNQISYIPDYKITDDMLQDFNIKDGSITEEGIRTNVKVGILYIQSWLLGQGAAALFNLMEDAATAEISRSQLWQWVHNNAFTDSGIEINIEFIKKIIGEELKEIKNLTPTDKMLDEAVTLFEDLIVSKEFEDFLTLPAYKLIN